MLSNKILKFNALAFLFIPLLFVACDDDDDTPTPVAPVSISATVAANSQFSTLGTLVEANGLTATLNDPAQSLTVFAPNNAAFSAADLSGLSDDQVRNILLYHVLGSRLAAADIAEGITIVTNGYKGPNNNDVVMIINKDGNAVKVNDATVVTADIAATNGIIHEVDKVILPPTVVGIAVNLPGFTSLVSALGTADGDLVTALSGDGPFTVFAPTDQAFSMTATGDLTTAQLSNVLQYHVLSGNVLSTDLPDGTSIDRMTLNGDMLRITRTGASVTIEDANGNVRNVVTADVQGANGVVHAIDGVLLP